MDCDQTGVAINRALSATLKWIESHLSDFAFDIEESPDRQLLLLKPFSELLLTCSLLSRRPEFDSRLSNCFSWAWDKLEAGDLLFRLLVARPDLYQLALPVAIFRSKGFENKRLNAVLKSISSLRSFPKFEAEAWVNVSALYSLDLLGIRDLSENDFQGCLLLERPEPWLVTNRAAYALTHEVFYLTDFGRKSDRMPCQIAAYLDCWTPVWLAFFRNKADWDLSSEIIMIGQCLGLSWTLQALEELTRSQLPSGAFVGPSGAGSHLFNERESIERKAFLSQYHTTLVAAIALSRSCELTVTHPASS